MTEPQTPAEQPDPETGEAQQQEPQATTEPKPTETVEFWKAQARRNEQQAKANADAARRLKEVEDRDLSELQRAQKQAHEATERLAALERQNTLLAKGIPVDLTPPAHNASADDWSAYADALIAWRGSAAPVPPAPSLPRPDPGQGVRGSSAPDLEAEYRAYEAAYFNPNKR